MIKPCAQNPKLRRSSNCMSESSEWEWEWDSESGSSDSESSPKKPKILDPITDEQAHPEATEEAALKAKIWNSCSHILEKCRKLSDQLYHSLLDGIAMLVYLIYDKDDLYRMHHSRIVYDQQRKFWDELEQEFDQSVKREPVYEACKLIVHKKVDQDRYSLLNEHDLGTLLSIYDSFPDKKPYFPQDCYDYGKGFVKSAIDDDIQEAIGRAKLCPRLSVDQYTSLLIDMVRGESDECQDLLLTKAEETIDIEALHALDAGSIEDLIIGPYTKSSAHEELYFRIKIVLLRVLLDKKVKVRAEAKDSTTAYLLLFIIKFFKGPSSQGEFDESKVDEYRRRAAECSSSVDIAHLIEVAELRRKAEGSRFIKRDHFLWAFDERGCGLRTAFKDELASRMAADDHPPYHIYETALTLANGERESLQAEHLAFAVVFGKSFCFSEEEVKEMQEHFQSFKTALRLRCVSPPEDWPMLEYQYDSDDY